MPTTIKLDPLIGFSLGYARPGERMNVSTRAMVTAEDGERFTILLDQISDCILSHVKARPDESTIGQLVVVLRPDSTADVFINEPPMVARVTAKKPVNAGEPVLQDSIADIHSVSFRGLDVPDDAGVLVLISSRWRRGVFYDFEPIARPEVRRPKDALGVALASLWTYLGFQDRLGLTDGDRARLSAEGWFPFIGLSTKLVRDMAEHVRAGWPADDLLDRVAAEVRTAVPRLRTHVKESPVFDGHRTVVLPALDHFENGDVVSAATMLYPRIEGLLRGHHAHVSAGVRASQSALAASAAVDARGIRHPNSLLLPERFEAYVRDVYFASFDPQAPQGVNRNTVGHGVAPEGDLGVKAAVLAVLIVEQLAFLCGRPTTAAEQPTAS